MENLKEMYAAYAVKATEVSKGASFFADFIGIGIGSKNHPCHVEFYDAVQKWLADFVAAGPAPEAAEAAAWFFLEEPKKYLERACYSFMYVNVGCIRSLVPYLTREAAAALAERFAALYKKKERMPVQVEALKMLQKKAK